MPDSLVEHARARIEVLILNGKLRPGERLLEQDLANRFGISRPPLREALKVLEGEGLVVREPRRGARVVKLTRHDVWEIYTLKASLFGLSTELAMPWLDQTCLEKLGRFVAKMRATVLSDEPDVSQYERAHEGFHSLIMDRAGSLRLASLTRTMQKPVRLISRLSLSDNSHMRRSSQYHADIHLAMSGGDSERAIHLTREHVLVALEVALELLPESRLDRGTNSSGFQAGRRLQAAYPRESGVLVIDGPSGFCP